MIRYVKLEIKCMKSRIIMLSHIGSEAGFEVDGGFLHLVVILADPLDDWIGDQTGEQSRGDGSVFVASSSGHFSSVPPTTGIGRSS